MKLIGITGHIATGKTTVINIFQKLKYPTISCDEVYHNLLKSDKNLQKKLVSVFGKEILERNKISTKKLAEIVSKSKKNLFLLEKITHPVILKHVFNEIKKLKKECPKLIVVDVPLLFEKKLQNKFDYIITVACSKKTQIERLKKRKIGTKVLKVLFSRQLPLRKKIKFSDFVINNDKISKKILKKKIKKLIQHLLQPLTIRF